MPDDVFHIIGAVSLLLYGIGSLLFPHQVGKLIAQELTTPRGIAEFRVVNGGYFIGLAGFALVANHDLTYTALGIGWLGAAGARLFAYVVDRPRLEPIYAGLLALEIALGIMLIV